MGEFVIVRALLGLVILILPLLNGQAQAATFAEKNFAQLVAEADQIFIGTVQSLQSRKLPSGAIVTDVRFSAPQVIKGDHTGADIVLLVLGGEVEGARLEIPGLPQFQRETRYLVFSQGNTKSMFPVVGGPAGFFQITADPRGLSPVVASSDGTPLESEIAAQVLDSLSPSLRSAAQSPITLELILAAIRAKLGLQ
ncbi:MAG: hypothetical protein HY661_21825 [Betaproteobacteria bacterium]|nr:hypothetical protein [Betaproteobacteria bacterium]